MIGFYCFVYIFILWEIFGTRIYILELCVTEENGCNIGNHLCMQYIMCFMFISFVIFHKKEFLCLVYDIFDNVLNG